MAGIGSKKEVPTGPKARSDRHQFQTKNLPQPVPLLKERLFHLVIKIEHVKQIRQCRHVGGHIGLILAHPWIGQIIAAAIRQWPELPIALNEFQKRDVIGISVVDLAAR